MDRKTEQVIEEIIRTLNNIHSAIDKIDSQLTLIDISSNNYQYESKISNDLHKISLNLRLIDSFINT